MKNPKTKFTKVFYVTLPAVLITFILAGPMPAKAKIKYIGSSTVGVFVKAASDQWNGTAIDIYTKPESGGGEMATASGKTDLGGVARDVKPSIIDKGVRKFLIGRDAIGVWIHASNRVADLSFEQLRGIFTGTISNWREVGGADQRINVYIVNPQSATRKVFQKVILQNENYKGTSINTIRPDSEIITRVGKDPGGIGQLSFALAKGHPASDSVKKIDVNGEKASVHNPGYPVTRPLYLITLGEPAGETARFIHWALSESGQQVVKNYFIGVK